MSTIPQNRENENARFDIYLGAMGLDLTKENPIPLGALEAWALFQDCMRRVAITEVLIIHVQTDTITVHWKEGKLLFP